jgi:ABC-2 type transport system permease protein
VARVDLKKMSVVFRREYLERVRTRWFLIGTLLGPVFMAAITILPVWIQMKQGPSTDLTSIEIIDATGTNLGARVQADLIKRFPAMPRPAALSVTPDKLQDVEDAAVRGVQRKEYNGFIVLDSLTVAHKSAKYAGRNAGSVSDVEQLMSSVRQQALAQRLEQEGLDPARVTSLTGDRLSTTTERVGDKGREKSGGVGNLAVGYIVSFLLYMMIALYGQNMLRGVLDEKTTRVAEVVLSSVSPDTLLAGKVLGIGMVAITQVLSWVGLTIGMILYLAPIVFKGMTSASGKAAGAALAQSRNLPTDMVFNSLPSVSSSLVMLAFFIFGFIFYSSLFAAVGATVSSQEDVQQAQMPVMLMLISSIIFMGPILTAPNSTLARTMTVIPFSAPILMPLRMSLVPLGWTEILISLGGVIIGCVAAIWISGRIYRVGMLMYGKRPSFGELVRWIKYAG